MAFLRHDITYALRTMRRRPLFTLTAVITLSLGIGAATSMFTVVNGVILRPLPYDDPDHLVYILGSREGAVGSTISYPDFDDIRTTARSFATVAAWQGWEVTLDGEDGAPTRITAASVSNTFFDLLGARAAAGRFFNEAEGRLGHAPAVVISYALWQRMFAGNRAPSRRHESRRRSA